jgi:uncharacterized protein YjbJ (UPF0337 family)
MSNDIFDGNWKVYANNILQHWDKLTKADLEATGGHRDLLAAKLQERYGISKDEAEKQIEGYEMRFAAL